MNRREIQFSNTAIRLDANSVRYMFILNVAFYCYSQNVYTVGVFSIIGYDVDALNILPCSALFVVNAVDESILKFSLSVRLNKIDGLIDISSDFDMALKRPFDDEVPSEVPNVDSFKHQRTTENSDQICLQMQDASLMADDQGQGDGPTKKKDFDADGMLANGRVLDHWEHIEEETPNGLPRSLSLSPWAAQYAGDDEHKADAHWSYVSEYFSFDRPVRQFIHIDDTCRLILDCPPRKQVPIGPDHQAEIPDLLQYRNGDCEDDRSDHLAGTCIIPFSEADLSGNDGPRVGDGRNDCSCWDEGSFRCVRHHIVEARERLQSSLGSLAFSELGFHDMGAVVANKWTEDDEHVFQEVVSSNPVSLGKNFWDVLSFVFPSRTKKEIVSYYFNVFMLRKRAEQNRAHPLHIDSDDDEWQGREIDDDNDEGGITEEDGGSAVESPVCDSDPVDSSSCLPENDDEDGDEVFQDEDGNLVFVPQKDSTSEGDSELRIQPCGKTKSDKARENDNQDGSCTSFDSGAPIQVGRVNPETWEQWREFTLEPCDSKAWDTHLSCPKNEVDLLPTFSMIEEVFGDGVFDSHGRRV
ncbi:AT-rich interactive domain-containing protein [Drosera capensis]